MPKSNGKAAREEPAKPYSDFPLLRHAAGGM